MVKVSIIVPIYNCEEYLEQCLRNALSQTIKELEIICVDDGSTDCSAQVVKDLQAEDARILLYQQKNQGAGSARNLGLQKAQGKYIAFLDADDYYVDNDALEILVDSCEKKKVPVCASTHMYVKGKKEYVKELFPKGTENDILCYRDWQMDYYYQSYLFRRELLIDHGIVFPEYRRYQDPPFFVKAAYTAGTFAVADTCLYSYRAQGAGGRYDMEKVCDLLKGILDNLLFARLQGLDILFRNTVGHLEHEITYIIYENISPDDLRILKLLMEINQLVCEQYGTAYFVVKPLRAILFSAEQYGKVLMQTIDSKEAVALYGAGKCTKAFLDYLREKDRAGKVKFIVVSDMAGNVSRIGEIPVIPLQQFLKEKECFLLVTVRKKLAMEIADGLDRNGYTQYEVLNEIFGDLLLRR